MTAVLYGPGEMGVVVIDISSDLNVTVTAEFHREEGSPESALGFARRMRQQHGAIAEIFALAIEDTAHEALKRRAKIPPQKPS